MSVHRLVQQVGQTPGVARVEAAEADLSAHTRTPSGQVVVAAFPTGAIAFAPALARSLRAHPALTLQLQQTGRGEGSSGLAFDRIIDLPPG